MSVPAFRKFLRTRWLAPVVCVGLAVAVGTALALAGDKPRAKDDEDPPTRKLMKAPELEGGIAWLNTGKPLTLNELKGKVVLLDFWTLCCINCIHVMPDIAKLERKYANELVVIGVHSAKFENEKNSESIRKAILRYN